MSLAQEFKSESPPLLGISLCGLCGRRWQVCRYGITGPKGWEWSTRNESASDVRRFIASYSGETDQLDFVNIPVEIR